MKKKKIILVFLLCGAIILLFTRLWAFSLLIIWAIGVFVLNKIVLKKSNKMPLLSAQRKIKKYKYLVIGDLCSYSVLKDFIDNPVRTYSSGMYMRLAFSVAINVDADILLIDEILSDIDGIADPENKVEIKLYIANKAVDMIETKYYEGDKNIANLVISSEVTGNDLVVEVTMRVQDDDQTAEISAKVQYKNILTLDNVEESVQVKILSEGTTEDIDMSVDFTNTVKFEERTIENFNENWHNYPDNSN